MAPYNTTNVSPKHMHANTMSETPLPRNTMSESIISSESITKTEQRSDGDCDELGEIRRLSRCDTFNVRLWRGILAFALLATAAVVTGCTFKFLDNEENRNFETAYDQFAITIEEALVDQQNRLRTAYHGVAKQVSTQVQTTGGTWPLVTVSNFGFSALPAMKMSRTESTWLMHVVEHDEVTAWINYTSQEHESMLHHAHKNERHDADDIDPDTFHPFITTTSHSGFVADRVRDKYFPVWEYAPAPLSYTLLNWNLLGSKYPTLDLVSATMEFKDEIVYGLAGPSAIEGGLPSIGEDDGHKHGHDGHSHSSSHHRGLSNAAKGFPHSSFFLAVRERIEDPDSPVVAVIGGVLGWDLELNDVLPASVKGVIIVIHNTCGQAHTYEINGLQADLLGEGDLHDDTYNKYMHEIDLSMSTNKAFNEATSHCRYSMKMYPSKRFVEPYEKWTPELFACVVSATFLFIFVLFVVYDWRVYRRNENMVENAAKSNAIVASLFPASIRKRLLPELHDHAKTPRKRIRNLKTYLHGESPGGPDTFDQPLADFFLETSVLFADIAGFTAWSSVREPSQVFSLLETVFSSFDTIANARRVFKVETVGDCYVAATGIPDARKDHAIVMVRFARDILRRMSFITKQMEATHGPETGDLSLRVGMHSGPVTAGVLRGERARFQLFGDAVDIAASMEHTGKVGRIQVSSTTAKILRSQGKASWLTKRENLVTTAGEGKIQTYWITGVGHTSADQQHEHSPQNAPCTANAVSIIPVMAPEQCPQTPPRKSAVVPASAFESMVIQDAQEPSPVAQNQTQQFIIDDGSSSPEPIAHVSLDARTERYVDWHVNMLVNLMKDIVAQREAIHVIQQHTPKSRSSSGSKPGSKPGSRAGSRGPSSPVGPRKLRTLDTQALVNGIMNGFMNGSASSMQSFTFSTQSVSSSGYAEDAAGTDPGTGCGRADFNDRGSDDMELLNDSWIPLNEVKDFVHLSAFNSQIAKLERPDDVDISEQVTQQLRSFVSAIASMYRRNAFHNFEHASHVTMSVIKLMSRIVAPGSSEINNDQKLHPKSQRGASITKTDDEEAAATKPISSRSSSLPAQFQRSKSDDSLDIAAATMHDHTYGITSDPMVRFACALSALIHDVDHCGVPNAQLVKEQTPAAQVYDGRSVAEQNSLVLAWELFMSDEYATLRSCVCPTASEARRLRQLVVNAVMATDIVDKDLKKARNERWDRAFNSDALRQSENDVTNQKATIVIEHLMQASDVAHTMQHWHIYRKWNELFFKECHAAYKAGRSQSNPIDTWYKSEIGFFDYYIIPLAKKLKECGVFGKSSDEYLNYALANRAEWERRGEEIVAEMAKEVAGTA